MSPVCAAPLCNTNVTVNSRCPMHGGLDTALQYRRTPPPLLNPWAAIAPDCPNGHHARRVFCWAYTGHHPALWYCADCRTLFPPGADGR